MDDPRPGARLWRARGWPRGVALARMKHSAAPTPGMFAAALALVALGGGWWLTAVALGAAALALLACDVWRSLGGVVAGVRQIGPACADDGRVPAADD